MTNELRRLQQLTCMGYEITVKWLPRKVKHHNGKRLAEKVVGDVIVIYAEDSQEAVRLVRHGFAESILNRHTKPYREFINKLIALFEERQYE